MMLQIYQRESKKAQGKAHMPVGDQRVKRPRKKRKGNLNTGKN